MGQNKRKIKFFIGVVKSQSNFYLTSYLSRMETLILITLAFLIAYILLRPISKKELKKFEENDNWSNMGF